MSGSGMGSSAMAGNTGSSSMSGNGMGSSTMTGSEMSGSGMGSGTMKDSQKGIMGSKYNSVSDTDSLGRTDIGSTGLSSGMLGGSIRSEDKKDLL